MPCLPAQICPVFIDANKTGFWGDIEKSQVETQAIGATTEASNTVFFTFGFVLCSWLVGLFGTKCATAKEILGLTIPEHAVLFPG